MTHIKSIFKIIFSLALVLTLFGCKAKDKLNQKKSEGYKITVRYESNAWYGHGYVSPLFYGDIFLYIPALLFLAGVPIFRVVNIYVLLVNLTTVLLCYYSFKGLFKDKYWGMFATICYALAGYRLTNIYVRSALGEYTAMAFLPLCIYGLYRIYVNKTEKSIGIFSLIFGLLT